MMGLMLVGVGMLMAQEPKKEPEPAPKVRGMLPKFYKQLGLSDDQRQTIYRVQGRYSAQIEALLEQVRKLRAEENAEIEKVLTEAQKTRLKELKLGETGKPKDSDTKPIDKGVTEKKTADKPPEDNKP
jgi:hypothetical protein